MELGVSHVQNLSSLTPIVDNIFDKYNKNLVPIRSLSDHDTREKQVAFCVGYKYRLDLPIIGYLPGKDANLELNTTINRPNKDSL